MKRTAVLEPEELVELLTAFDAGERDRPLLKALVKHFLGVLVERSPGHSVEVRVPPFAAVQAITGARHVRGTPPAVVETDATTWIELASGSLSWTDAAATGRISASGERSDLTAYLPLT